ncbi:glycosyltransferase [Micromonospora fluostatini]|uniref:Glycosyltransferase n=1 Tax=Micromonospora fluostatini TaxID=1629071 RepID=A0ABY2DL04_9ACTN|nr:glycosyltransferase [Micromonospora fluostatini]
MTTPHSATPGCPEVSVVVPTYNRAPLLHRTLAALAAQRPTGPAFEVVVSDDGSADDTRAVVDAFADRLTLRYHFQPDEGFRVAEARNAGARLASAPVLAFLDTGVLVGPDFVAAHRAAHQGTLGTAGPGRAVIGYTYGYNPYDPCPGLAELLAELPPAEVVARLADTRSFQDMRHPEFAAVDFDLSRLAAPWMLSWTVNLSVRAEDFRAVGGFDEGFRSWGVEDLEFGYRTAGHGVRFAVSRDAWAIETPHDRDTEANLASSRRNARRFLDKHGEPPVELYWAIYSRGILVPLEQELRTLSGWAEQARDLDVRAELAAAVEALPAGGRIAAIGCGGVLPPSWPATGTLVDFDEELLRQAAADRPAAPARLAIGLRTPYDDASFDLVVVSSRLTGLHDRWGDDLRAEAHRIGRDVRVHLPAQ